MSTKEKIKKAAIRCFNRDGISAVRLAHIAEEANMSVGNMTYHFRTKEDIVRGIWEQLEQAQRILLTEFRVLPLFEDIERLLESTFRLQNEYTFFYLDMLEIMRAYPEIQELYRQHLHWQIQQMHLALEFSCSRGAMRTIGEPDGFTAWLAAQFWATTDMWKYRCRVQGMPLDDYLAFRENIWYLFIPVMTEMGLVEYKQTTALFVT